MLNKKKLVEGLLFIIGEEGMSIEELSNALEITIDEVFTILDQLEKEYLNEDRAFKLVNLAGQYKLVTSEEIFEEVEKVFKEQKSTPLSNSALETLAIIAYKQPITRVEIEDIRGVGCEVMLKKLVAKELIEEAGRLDVIGRPIIYRVTNNFLDLFKLSSLEELPKLDLNNEIEDDNLFVVSGE